MGRVTIHAKSVSECYRPALIDDVAHNGVDLCGI